jgi:hypothetical protein
MRWLGGRMTRAAGRWTRAAEVGWRLCDAVAHGLAVLPQSLPSAKVDLSRSSRLPSTSLPSRSPKSRRRGWSENSCGWRSGRQEFDLLAAQGARGTP